MRTINGHLGDLIGRTDTVITRQNMLTVLFLIAMGLISAQIALGVGLQTLQKSAKVQLAAQEVGRVQVQHSLELAKAQVERLQEQVVAMRQQLQNVPTVTSDKTGRLNLEVPVQADPKKAGDEAPVPPPEKVVIPLKTGQTRVAN